MISSPSFEPTTSNDITKINDSKTEEAAADVEKGGGYDEDDTTTITSSTSTTPGANNDDEDAATGPAPLVPKRSRNSFFYFVIVVVAIILALGLVLGLALRHSSSSSNPVGGAADPAETGGTTVSRCGIDDPYCKQAVVVPPSAAPADPETNFPQRTSCTEFGLPCLEQHECCSNRCLDGKCRRREHAPAAFVDEWISCSWRRCGG